MSTTANSVPKRRADAELSEEKRQKRQRTLSLAAQRVTDAPGRAVTIQCLKILLIEDGQNHRLSTLKELLQADSNLHYSELSHPLVLLRADMSVDSNGALQRLTQQRIAEIISAKAVAFAKEKPGGLIMLKTITDGLLYEGLWPLSCDDLQSYGFDGNTTLISLLEASGHFDMVGPGNTLVRLRPGSAPAAATKGNHAYRDALLSATAEFEAQQLAAARAAPRPPPKALKAAAAAATAATAAAADGAAAAGGQGGSGSGGSGHNAPAVAQRQPLPPAAAPPRGGGGARAHAQPQPCAANGQPAPESSTYVLTTSPDGAAVFTPLQPQNQAGVAAAGGAGAGPSALAVRRQQQRAVEDEGVCAIAKVLPSQLRQYLKPYSRVCTRQQAQAQGQQQQQGQGQGQLTEVVIDEGRDVMLHFSIGRPLVLPGVRVSMGRALRAIQRRARRLAAKQMDNGSGGDDVKKKKKKTAARAVAGEGEGVGMAQPAPEGQPGGAILPEVVDLTATPTQTQTQEPAPAPAPSTLGAAPTAAAAAPPAPVPAPAPAPPAAPARAAAMQSSGDDDDDDDDNSSKDDDGDDGSGPSSCPRGDGGGGAGGASSIDDIVQSLFQRSDNRMGLPGSLHRISAVRGQDGRSVTGLTYRIGRHVPGAAAPLRDLLYRMARYARDPASAAAISSGGAAAVRASFVAAGGGGGGSRGGGPGGAGRGGGSAAAQPSAEHTSSSAAAPSLLLLGPPGVGKTTLLRDVARMLSTECGLRVAVVDSSAEIAGDSSVPHACIGHARRFFVPHGKKQSKVLLEVVKNHNPQVIIVDEIGGKEDVVAVQTVSQRGVQVVATAHGGGLGSLMKNPILVDLLGGITTVTLGDERAIRRNMGCKTRLERAGVPVFGQLVEVRGGGAWLVHTDVAESVDMLLEAALASGCAALHTQLRKLEVAAGGGGGRVLTQFSTRLAAQRALAAAAATMAS